jgi:RNA polymerase sigma-70 factor (ECF subfamily)
MHLWIGTPTKPMAENPHEEFLTLYKPLHRRFVKYCDSMAWGIMEPRDLVQETTLVVLQKWNSIQKKESLLAFMIGTASNLVKMNLRKMKHQTRLEAESDAIRNLEAKTQSPDLAYDIQLMYKALDQLSYKEKECLILFEISGFAVKEICEIQGEGESAIKARLSRTRQKLRQILEDEIPKHGRSNAVSAIFNSIALL